MGEIVIKTIYYYFLMPKKDADIGSCTLCKILYLNLFDVCLVLTMSTIKISRRTITLKKLPY